MTRTGAKVGPLPPNPLARFLAPPFALPPGPEQNPQNPQEPPQNPQESVPRGTPTGGPSPLSPWRSLDLWGRGPIGVFGDRRRRGVPA